MGSGVPPSLLTRLTHALDHVLHPGALYPGGCQTRSVLSTLSHMRDLRQMDSGTDSVRLGLLPAPRTAYILS